MKKIAMLIAAAVLAAAMCLGATGCGKKDSASTLWVTVPDSQEELLVQAKLAKAFTEKKKAEGQDVTLKRNTLDVGKYGETVSKLIAQGEIGDVVFTYDTYAAQYSEQGLFEDLDSYIARDGVDLDLYNKTIIDSARAYQGQLSYFPRSYDQVTIFINYDFFVDLGMENDVPVPKDNGQGERTWDWWTWSELCKLCEKLRAAINEKMTAAQASYYYPLDANLSWNAVYDPIIRSFGGYTVDVTTLDSGFNKANANAAAYNGTLKALGFMKDLLKKNYTPMSTGAFAAGNNAMAFMTRPSVTGAIDADIELRFAPLPRFDTGIDGIGNDSVSYVGYGSGGYALNKNSKKKDLAWEFIEFAISEQGQAIIAGEGRCIPTLKSQLTIDGSWTDYVKDQNGNNVDQSAFLYDGNTLSLATYARGVATDTEYQIYSKIRNSILGQLDSKTPAATADYLYDQIKAYIRK